MSQASVNVIYPQSTDRDLSRWHVREDDDDYGKLSRKLLELHDRLVRADALTYLVQTAENPPEHVANAVPFVSTSLIRLPISGGLYAPLSLVRD